MAIGTLAAIGLGAAGVGSFLGGKSAKKAATKAADTSLQVANQNNALASDIYGQNQQALSPYMARGNVAGDQMNAMLGLGGGFQAPQGAQTAYGGAGAPNSMMSLYSGANPGGAPMGLAQQDRPVQQGPQYGVPASRPNPGDPFEVFRNSTGYQFRLGQGMDALNSGYAGAGTLQSGAAMKAAQEYGQNFASNEFGNYMGYLGNQQGVGLSGASALAGVGQNYANSVMTNNNNAGTAVANAALARGANNPFANTLGMIGGGLWGMSR